MDVKVKIRFNASKEQFETYGGNRYLIYLPFPDDEDSFNIIVGMLSKKIGVPINKIHYKDKDPMGNWIFQLE
ncbi:MAG: hypothetical protein WCK29_02605 [archaeon]